VIISSLQLSDYRSYERLAVEWPRGVIVLVGRNGAGKTNLLESMVLACTGHGLGPLRDQDAVRHGAEGYAVAVAGTANGVPFNLRRNFRLPDIRTLAADGPFSPPANPAPVVTFSPEDVYIIKGAPAARRRYLDELAMTAITGYRRAWLDYHRAVRQRNELLRAVKKRLARVADLEPWEMQLAVQAARVHTGRLRVHNALAGFVAQAYERLAGAGRALQVTYRPDIVRWLGLEADIPPFAATSPKEEHLVEAYRRVYESMRSRDVQLGVTSAGPHRDDLEITVDRLPARTHASQGQQRAAALALRMAQSMLVEDATHEKPVICLDDVYSELDDERRRLVTEFLMGYSQAFVSAASWEGLPSSGSKPLYYYVVEDGLVRPFAI